MSTMMPEVISETNLSYAWARAFLLTMERNKRTISPLLISVTGFTAGIPAEDKIIRDELDNLLVFHNKIESKVSAMLIFPFDLWNRIGRQNVIDFSKSCNTKYIPRLKSRDSRNNKGTYFERMIAFEGSRKKGGIPEVDVKNQLEHIISVWKRDKKNGRRPRHSALQVACFDPVKDHTGQPVRGFPCLQQVSLAYDDKNRLAVNAYYPTQYIFDRAYGNYLGLCHLGYFMAVEMGLEMARLNCYIGQPMLGDINKASLAGLYSMVRGVIK